ncbi:unnamed protein product [Ranitomeya imitator]|uniref:Reverse transcriptase domain-containing protein n=1 Tax=Ranitomeya imitator TaxID=111125 RepID=A0ABN9LRN8_9NEOB|nr:unnamed protein product [Ranitomeya imitator]
MPPDVELHCATLSEYLRVKRIPRGLRVALRPTLFHDNSDYCAKYTQILNKCSFDLMTLTVEFLHKKIEANAAEIRNIETQLSSAGTSEELNALKVQIQTRVDQHKKDTENRKRSKFTRDTIDYEQNQVYRWHNNSSTRRPSPRNPRSSTDFSTSGSDAERDTPLTSQAPFLGQRHGFPQRKRGGGNTRNDDTDRIRVTRSMVGNHWLKAYFSTTPISPPDVGIPDNPLSVTQLGLRNKSHFRPPHASHAVETFIGFIQKSFIKGAPLLLWTNPSIFRKSNDNYRTSRVYTKLDRDPTSNIQTKIGIILQKYSIQGILDSKTIEFLTKSNPVIPVFYILPKVHKSMQNLPGRPIVASTESVLSPLSIFLEKILTPLISNTPSFLLDTVAFLNKIRSIDTIPPQTILVTLDGINSVHHLLTSAGLDSEQINLCVDLLTLILYNNHFLFQDQFYLQVRGTAMGSNVAPPYANAYMAHFEESIIYRHQLFISNVLYWTRYIDDIFCLWGGTLESLETFFTFLNEAWPGIRFTITHDSNSVSFLDTTVLKDQEGHLTTDLHTKPTDRNSILHFDSFHPPSVKRSIPRS